MERQDETRLETEKESPSLFADLDCREAPEVEAPGKEEDVTKLKAQGGTPSLFESGFESKMSVWKSYREEKDEGEPQKTNKFWEANEARTMMTSLDDLVAIEPKVLRRIMHGESGSKKIQYEGTMHPSLAGDLALCDGSKAKRVCTDDSKVENESRVDGSKVNSEKSIRDEKSVGLKEEAPADSKNNQSTENIFNRETGNGQTGFLDSVKSKDECGSFSMAQEVIQNLENKIEALNCQIKNYKQALTAKDDRIKELEMALEYGHDDKADVDYLCVETYVKRAVEILEKIKGQSFQPKPSNETSLLLVENENLKAIIEELSLRLKQQKSE